MPERLYLVTRADLPAGDQAVQAAHALTEFLVEHPEVARDWHDRNNTLAFLVVPDERSLARLLDRAFDRDVRASAFREPDLNGSLTAIAIEPTGSKLVRSCPLALQNVSISNLEHGASERPPMEDRCR